MQDNTKHWKLVRLNFGRTPVHFGEKGIGLESTSERVSSDTLFSALVTAYARCYGKAAVKALLDRFQENPLFRLSSTFVYRQIPDKNEPIYYLPKLLELPKNYPAGKDDLEFAKTFKSLNYLPLLVWQRWYQGDGFEESDRAQLIAKTGKNENGYKGQSLDQAGTFDYSKAFASYQLPKVAVDRTTRATNFYHTGLVQFAWEPSPNTNNSEDEQVVNLAGLYFLIQFAELGSAVDELHSTLELLGEEGIGGERSSGAGRFEAEWLDLPREWQEVIQFSGEHHGLISLFWEHPLTESLLTDATRYGLQERGGWIASPFSGQQQRRKALQMFTEGSVFPVQPQGRLADVTPSDREGNRRFHAHNVYRSGIALSLPVSVVEAQ
jgi:CRISPR-associated protein Csm4